MLTTTGIHDIGIEIQDSTVVVFPGTARIGNTLVPFDGTRKTFDDIIYFAGDSNKYQNALLYLDNLSGIADMTRALSDTTSALRYLDLPVMPSDASNPYSPQFPLGMFTFYSSDGIHAELVSYEII